MAEIWIDDVIGEDFWGEGFTARRFRDLAADIDPEEDLVLRINSPGGSVFEAVSIMSQIAERKGTVNVLVDGLAASAASYIATAGQTVRMADGAMLMIHEPWSVVIGNSQDMLKEATLLDKIGGTLAVAYAGKSGAPSEAIREAMLAETWYTAGEAVDIGLADEIVSTKAKAIRVPENFGYRNAPRGCIVPARTCKAPETIDDIPPHDRVASQMRAKLIWTRARESVRQLTA